MTTPRAHVTRHFATVTRGRWGARQVHYRRAGRGPAVLMLHQSPLSSRDLLPAIERWHSQFTCIAPDTPGFGCSDPLGVAEAGMEDIAEAVREFLDAIGIERVVVYGFHTGAMIAAAFAERYPERCLCAVSNGYVVLTESERADYVANYLPPFEPKWDGSHLTWLWARMREQTIFFPWYRPHLANRMDIDVPTPERLMVGLVDFLRAGDHYRVGYRAAFTYRSDAALTRIRVPMLVIAADTDPLKEQLPRIVEKTPHVETRVGGTMEQTLDQCAAFLARYATTDSPVVAPTLPLPGRTWNDMVNVEGGQLRVRRSIAAGGRTLLVQHDAASSSDIVDPVSRSLIEHASVLAIDLPGHGESDNTIGTTDVTVPRYVDVVWQALDALGIDEVDAYGMWGGGLVALEMACQQPKRVRHLVMSNVLWHSDAERAELKAHYTPRIEPNWYGGHLLMCWHLMRDQGLFWPWYDRTRRGILWKEPHVDPTMVQARVLDMLKAPEMWRLAYQAHFDYPLQAQLARVKVPTLLCSPQWDPNLSHTEQAAAANPACQLRRLPDALGDWGPAFADFLQDH